VGEAFAEAELDTLWHYYAMTWDGDSLRVYRDGAYLDARPAGGVFQQNQSSGFRAWIGHSDYGTQYTAGLADELRISGVARSAAEIFDTAVALGFAESSVSAEEGAAPRAFALHAPYPNPFANRATLAFDLPQPAMVRLAVFDALGREMAVLVEGKRAAGRHEAVFDAAGLPGGAYFVRIEAGTFAATQRMVLVR